MIEKLFNRLEALFESQDADGENREEQIQLATAALLLEVARSDAGVDQEERARIATLLQSVFPVSGEELSELIDDATRQVEAATDLFQFTGRINDELTYKEKQLLVRQMWQVAWADGDVSSYEDHIIRRVSGLLHVSHEDFIRAKIEARPG